VKGKRSAKRKGTARTARKTARRKGARTAAGATG
jgi:hypothetical protein